MGGPTETAIKIKNLNEIIGANFSDCFTDPMKPIMAINSYSVHRGRAWANNSTCSVQNIKRCDINNG